MSETEKLNATNSSDGKEKEVTSETIFDYVGNIGFYQIFAVTILTYLGVPNGAGGYLMVYTHAKFDYRCYIPEYDSTNVTVTTDLLKLAIPPQPESKQDVCHPENIVFDPCLQYSEILNASDFGVDSAETITCQNGHYWGDSVGDRTSTAVKEHKLICENGWINGVSTSIYFAALCLSGLTAGFFSDNFGRKNITMYSMLLFQLSFLGQIYSPNLYVYTAFRATQGFFGMSSYLAAFCLAMEMVPSKYRGTAGFMVHIFFCTGALLLPIFAYFIRGWKGITWVLFLGGLPCLYWVKLSESPIWLTKKNKTKEAVEAYARIGRANKVENLDEKEIERLVLEIQNQAANNPNEEHGLVSPISLFRINFMMSMLALKSSIMWMATSLTYYGISLTPGNLPGSIYVNAIIYGVIDLIANVLALKLIDVPRLGRRWVTFGAFFVCGASILTSVILLEQNKESCDSAEPSETFQFTIRFLNFLGKFCVSGVFGCIYQYTGELFPVKIKATAVAFSSFMGKLITIVTPQVGALAVYQSWLPGCIYGSICLLAAAAVYTLPETRNRNIESLEDCERLIKGKK